MRRTIVAALFASLFFCGCSAAVAEEVDDGATALTDRTASYATAKFAQIDDISQSEAARSANAAIMEQRAEEERIAAEIAAQQAIEDAATWEPEYYAPSYYAPSYSVQGDPDGLNSFVGVVDGPNGTTETAYSSNVLYHYRTSEWTPDEYGFYRTDDGYYVVASSDYEQGTVIETSRGEAMVLDSGCDSGVVDFYTDWR